MSDFIKRSDIESRAKEVLQRHGLFSIPIDPVLLANREGIKVHNAKFSDESLSGMIAKRGEARTLLVNQGEPPFRKRFTIAHELGHHFLHLAQDGEFVDNAVDLFRETGLETESDPKKREEVQANIFAASLLMPEELVLQQFALHPQLRDLARIFNVSEMAMGIRLARLGLG